jgi:cytochrome c oxidase assembly protein subunit 15
MNSFQRIALTAFICLEVLILFGAIVRATGSGLGCPDWPRCYGCLIPPTSADQIDFTKLDLAKFQRKAALAGEDPATITPETLRARFNPVETWIEYLNRVSSIPLFITVLAMMVASFRQPNRLLRHASLSAFALFMMNAVLGFLVVKSLLKPNNVTLHMALAILMLCVLVFITWRGAELPWRITVSKPSLLYVALSLFALIVIEGVMGSQVRELTDDLARTHTGQARSVWVHELEQTGIYLIHRSASWLIVILGILFNRSSKTTDHSASRLQNVILALIIAQMCLGVVLSQIGILAVAQIAHIVLSSLLVSALFLWLLAARRTAIN